MHLKTFTLALVLVPASCHNHYVRASFRDIPIALPPIGEPLRLRAPGSYNIKLVHQWPPLHFDRMAAVEYYEPYGYVYLNEEDGLEYIFDSTATRPVIREPHAVIVEPIVAERLVVEPLVSEPFFNFVRANLTAPIVYETAPVLLSSGSTNVTQDIVINQADVSVLHSEVPNYIQLPSTPAIPEIPKFVQMPSVQMPAAPLHTEVPNYIQIPAEDLSVKIMTPPAPKHLNLRGFVDALTFIPANLFKDAIVQGRAMLIGKERKLFDLERLFGDVIHRDCARDGLCIDAADTWISYVAAIREQAQNFETKMKTVIVEADGEVHEVVVPSNNGFEAELMFDCGRALIKRIEAARMMLMKECENLPSVIDRHRLVQLLVTPLEYLQGELEIKADSLLDKKQDFGKFGLEMINKQSSKMEKAISSTMEHLLKFPTHILHDIRKDFKIEF